MRLFLGLLFIVPQMIDAVEFRPDYQYNEKVDGWIKFHNVPATWQRAQFRCDLEGAILASPTNEKLLDAMWNMTRLVPTSMTSIFTGIHATFSKGDYFTVNGVPLSKISVHWAPNQPDNLRDSEDCLILTSKGTLADVNCSAVYPYMCYRKRIENMPPVTECDTIDPKYHFEPRTGSCYKYHSVARSWPAAFMTCTAEGGHLAIVNSPTEAQVFKEMYDSHPPLQLYESRSDDTFMREYDANNLCVFLGFRKWDEQQDWLTINGETLEEAGYDVWIKYVQPVATVQYYPNMPSGFCGSLEMGKYEIGFRKLLCSVKKPFICERVPKKQADKVSQTQEPSGNST